MVGSFLWEMYGFVVGSVEFGGFVVGSVRMVGSLVAGCYIQLKDPNVGIPYTACAQSVSEYTRTAILCAVCVHR